MLYIRICYDKPGVEDLRKRLRGQHLAYVKPNMAAGSVVRVLHGGPLCANDVDKTYVGSFMVLEAKRRDDVKKFHDEDPFTAGGLYERADIQRWDQHITDGMFHG